ncbi:hypothetical protein P7C71_g4039, partial [Lecanoromycetidae sp. Uapishka_2]
MIGEAGEDTVGHKHPGSELKATGETSLSNQRPHYAKGGRKVFLGRMGTDPDFDQSIPNAWMASTPGHPFWLLPLEACAEHQNGGWGPEDLTGPAALFHAVLEYQEKYHDGKGKKLDRHYAKSGWSRSYKHSSYNTPALPPHSLEILPFWEIYPYSWHRDGQMYREVCWVSQPTFNATKCKLLLALEHWNSHSITYWSHSWNREGHSEESLDALNKSDKQKPAEGRKMEGDAMPEDNDLIEERENQEHANEHEHDENFGD